MSVRSATLVFGVLATTGRGSPVEGAAVIFPGDGYAREQYESLLGHLNLGPSTAKLCIAHGNAGLAASEHDEHACSSPLFFVSMSQQARAFIPNVKH
jgi:hypothetical protein